MAAAGIAPVLGKDRHDLAGEVDRGVIAKPLDDHGDAGVGEAGYRDDDLAGAIPLWHDHASGRDESQCLWFDPVGSLVRDVADAV